MTHETLIRILNLQEAVQRDPSFRPLLLEYEQHQQELLDALKTMPAQQQDAVFDFLGVMIELHHRMLEAALK